MSNTYRRALAALLKLDLENWSDSSGRNLFRKLELDLNNSHNALEDAQEQAKLFKVIRDIKCNF